MKRLIEDYLGYPANAPGEGTAWSWEWILPWPNEWPLSFGIVVLLGVIGLGGLALWRESSSVPWRDKLPLFVTRLSMLLVVFFCLSRVNLTVERTGTPVVVLMVDDSASMLLEDEFHEAAQVQQLQSLGLSVTQPLVQRIELQRAILGAQNGAFLRRLVEHHKLVVYRFDESARTMALKEYVTDDDVDTLLEELSELTARGQRTNLARSVRDVLQQFQGGAPAAIVLLTDGVATTSSTDRLSQVATLSRRQDVPFYCLGIGQSQPIRDVALLDVVMDDVAVVGATIRVTGKLRTFGFAGQSALVSIRESTSRTVVAQTRQQLADDRIDTPFECVFRPERAGEFDYQIEVQVSADEANRDNNRVMRHVSVRQARLKVLLAERESRYEFRYLKHLLERIQQQHGTVDLQTVLQSGDALYVEQDSTAAALEGRFPLSREALFQFDVIICGDLNLDLIPAAAVQNLADFVTVHGGGLVLIAGDKAVPYRFAGTPLEKLLPIDLSEGFDSHAATFQAAFQPRWTIAGRSLTPQFSSIPAVPAPDGSQFLQSELLWSMTIAEDDVRPGAVTLVERTPGADQSATSPLVVLQQTGNGKVVLQGTDEIWRWRYRAGDRWLQAYWMGMIQFLSRTRLLGRDRSAELLSDRVIYREGEDIILRVRFLDGRIVAADDVPFVIAWERGGDAQQQVTLRPSSNDARVLEAVIPDAKSGNYHAWIISPVFEDASPTCDFRVESTNLEMRQRTMDAEDLRRAAELSGGAYFDTADFVDLPTELPRGRPLGLGSVVSLALWNRWELLVVFAAAFTVDRLIRRRLRLR